MRLELHLQRAEPGLYDLGLEGRGAGHELQGLALVPARRLVEPPQRLQADDQPVAERAAVEAERDEDREVRADRLRGGEREHAEPDRHDGLEPELRDREEDAAGEVHLA